MKTPCLLLIFFHLFSLETFAAYPFNGVFCGRGTLRMKGQEYTGTKILEVTASDSFLHLKRSRVHLDNGSYLEGRPEQAQIVDGKIVFENTVVGTISEEEIHTHTSIDGYDIDYLVKNLGENKVSYMRTSVNGSFRMEENFPELLKSSNCR
jgi:hypothetical protein